MGGFDFDHRYHDGDAAVYLKFVAERAKDMPALRTFDTGAADFRWETLTPLEKLAWAAGLFEGEGWIGWQHTKGRVRKDGTGGERRYHYPRLAISLTDADVLKRFHTVVGVGTFMGPYAQRRNKPMWQWKVSGRKAAVGVINQFMPFLGARRRARALEVFGADI